jgi:REP element-mobilizing transposase RayT
MRIIERDPTMTIARAHRVDPAVTRWYHCITRCVRRAFLFGEGANDCKVWIETRLREPTEIFSVAVGGFSVLDNHLHVLVRLDPCWHTSIKARVDHVQAVGRTSEARKSQETDSKK